MSENQPAMHAVKLSDFLADMPAPIKKAKSLEEFIGANRYYYDGGHLRSGLVWLDNDDILCIKAYHNEDYYWIEKGSRLSASQMWEWTQHMHGKAWMTPAIMYDFIFLCGRPSK